MLKDAEKVKRGPTNQPTDQPTFGIIEAPCRSLKISLSGMYKEETFACVCVITISDLIIKKLECLRYLLGNPCR